MGREKDLYFYDRGKHVAICQSKRWFVSMDDAEVEAAKSGDDVSLYSYQCNICHLWHLTSSKPDPIRNQRNHRNEKIYRRTLKRA